MSTIEVLKAESKKHRDIAAKIDALIADLQPDTSAVAPAAPVHATASLPGIGEYASMKQADAIKLVLRKFGPQTTTEVFNRLAAGGMSFKKVAYVTAILARFRDQWERLPDGKIFLKPEA